MLRRLLLMLCDAILQPQKPNGQENLRQSYSCPDGPGVPFGNTAGTGRSMRGLRCLLDGEDSVGSSRLLAS